MGMLIVLVINQGNGQNFYLLIVHEEKSADFILWGKFQGRDLENLTKATLDKTFYHTQQKLQNTFWLAIFSLYYSFQLLPCKREITLLLYEAQSAFECSLRMPVGL